VGSPTYRTPPEPQSRPAIRQQDFSRRRPGRCTGCCKARGRSAVVQKSLIYIRVEEFRAEVFSSTQNRASARRGFQQSNLSKTSTPYAGRGRPKGVGITRGKMSKTYFGTGRAHACRTLKFESIVRVFGAKLSLSFPQNQGASNPIQAPPCITARQSLSTC
jgi:hypothetical protein